MTESWISIANDPTVFLVTMTKEFPPDTNCRLEKREPDLRCANANHALHRDSRANADAKYCILRLRCAVALKLLSRAFRRVSANARSVTNHCLLTYFYFSQHNIVLLYCYDTVATSNHCFKPILCYKLVFSQ